MAAQRPVTGNRDGGLFTEICWAALHGMVTLTRAGRLPPAAHQQRVTMLVDMITRG